MKTFEAHISVSYISGGERYHDVWCEYIEADTKAAAKKQIKAACADEGVKVEHIDVLEA